MTDTRRVVNLIYRVFLCSWIFAILWAKGYLWSLFGLALFLVLLDLYLAAYYYAWAASAPPDAKTRPKPKGGRPRKADDGQESSWREPRPQWSEPPAQKS